MRRFRPALVLIVMVAGCTCTAGSDDGKSPNGASGVYAGGLPPNETLAQFPRDDRGRPVLLASAVESAPGVRLALAYDKDLDDAIARYGECLGLLTSCLRGSSSLDGCVDSLKACDSNAGGRGCCAPSCVSAYRSARAAGKDEDAAADETFVRGDCLTGFVGMVSP